MVTGGAGFIGSHLSENLVRLGAKVTVIDSLENGTAENLSSVFDKLSLVKANLLDSNECAKACAGMDVVINLAAKVAGVSYNAVHSADMFRINVKIGLNVLDAARIADVQRVVSVSSACVYSGNSTVPTPEEEGFFDEPEQSNLGYGWAKRFIEIQSRLYVQQYGMDIAIVRPFNTYGPRDHFSQDGHVIPSLIRRALEGENPLVVWGDGTQTRSFVYVTDVARGLVLAAEKAPAADPINIGNPEEVSIASLANLVIRIANPRISVQFDTSKPKGQQKRCPNNEKAKRTLGYYSTVNLDDGIKRTVDWYETKMVRNPVPLSSS